MLMVLSQPAQALTSECAAAHLWDAIALNKARMPVYAELSDRDSKALSRILITSEYAALLAAYPFEHQARYFWQHDIPILCKDFVSMHTVKPIEGLLDAYPPTLKEFSPPDGVKLQRELETLYRAQGFTGLHRRITDVIADLSDEPRFLCMTRHVLESAARIAWLAPQYDQLAAEKGLRKRPSDLSHAVLVLHLKSVPLAVAVDKRAAPLAARGLGIICDDVPSIDLMPNLDETNH